MTYPCDEVVERLALGESLEPLAEHIASCAACARLAQVPRRIGAAHPDIDPGLGFSARMTVGAQHRLVARRRRRVAAGLAATVAAGAFGVFVFPRAPAAPPAPVTGLAPPQQLEEPRPDPAAEAADVEVLVDLADTGRSSRVSADWRALERPLRGYGELVKQALIEAVEGESP